MLQKVLVEGAALLCPRCLISPLPPQTPGPLWLQPGQEQLPSRRRRLLEAGPEVRLLPPPTAFLAPPSPGASPWRPPLEGTAASLVSTFRGHRQPRGKRGEAGGQTMDGVDCMHCPVSLPPPGSLTWLWPGHLRRLRRFLLGNLSDPPVGGAGGGRDASCCLVPSPSLPLMAMALALGAAAGPARPQARKAPAPCFCLSVDQNETW